MNGALGKPGFAAGDTILVASGTYTGTGDEVLLLDQDVTLSGGWDPSFSTQSGSSTIDGEHTRRGMTVNNGMPAVVEHLAIQDGFSDYGGGINNHGILTLTNSTVNGNMAHYSGGGALANAIADLHIGRSPG